MGREKEKERIPNLIEEKILDVKQKKKKKFLNPTLACVNLAGQLWEVPFIICPEEFLK